MGGLKLMKIILLAACVLSLAFAGAGNAQSADSSQETGAHHTKAQLKRLALDAHAPDQYNALASYFGEQHDKYLQKAAEEKKEWESLSQNVSSAAAKYPRPSDSARNLYEYYTHKASEAGALEAKYSQLASPGALAKAQ
jgi:hypothetical protein